MYFVETGNVTETGYTLDAETGINDRDFKDNNGLLKG